KQEQHVRSNWMEIRNPNIEIRNKSKIRISKAQNETPFVWVIRIWHFEFVSDFDIRISDFPRAAANDDYDGVGPFLDRSIRAAVPRRPRFTPAPRTRAAAPSAAWPTTWKWPGSRT